MSSEKLDFDPEDIEDLTNFLTTAVVEGDEALSSYEIKFCDDALETLEKDGDYEVTFNRENILLQIQDKLKEEGLV